ncbi:MAG: DUF6751 family protein [Oscillospiraceae bacterium]
MLGFDSTITIVNSLSNPASGFNDYFLTVISNVSWHSQNKVIAEGQGLANAKIFKVRIPNFAECEKEFVPPEAYTNPSTQYTLRHGDKVVLGLLAEGINTPEAWAGLTAQRAEAFTIMAYHDNRKNIGLQHIFTEGK